MVRLMVGLVILLAIVYNFFLINNAVEDPARQSLSRFFKMNSHPPSIREQYGEYGRDLSQDYRQYRFQQQPKNPAEVLMPKPDFNTPLTDSKDIANNLGSPYGKHGNNYSLYDINSPTGHWGKL